MRWLLGLVAMLGASLQAEAACIETERFNRVFQLGDMVESTPPSELTIGAVLVRRDVDEENRVEECRLSTVVSVEVAATDDTTPSEQLGIRTGVNEYGGDQLPNRTGSDFGLLLIVFRGIDFDLDFDLHLSAIDQSGNVGPETIIPIHSDAPGCNGAGAWSLVPGLAILGLLRRRRPSRIRQAR